MWHFKDLVCGYKTMQGFSGKTHKGGWDIWPTSELGVEKLLGT
jgi:hypothetical protein